MAPGHRKIKTPTIKQGKKNIFLSKARKSIWKMISNTKFIRGKAITFSMLFIEL